MASSTSTTSTTRTPADDDLATTAKGIASDVADKAVAAAQRLPDAANATGVQLERASQIIQSESDEVLAVGTSLSLGLAMGLLLGGANRLLVILALIPATAMGFTLFDRHGGTRGTRPRASTRRPGGARLGHQDAGRLAPTGFFVCSGTARPRGPVPEIGCSGPGHRAMSPGPGRAERPEEGAPGVRGIGCEGAPSQAPPRGCSGCPAAGPPVLVRI
jgi:hypothetical protein